jgi:hypothetical protein
MRKIIITEDERRRILNIQKSNGKLLSENKMGELINSLLNSVLGDLEIYETPKYPNHIFFLQDGRIIIVYDKNNRSAVVSSEDTSGFIKEIISMDYGNSQEQFDEFKDSITNWVRVNYIPDVKSVIPKTSEIVNRWYNID